MIIESKTSTTASGAKSKKSWIEDGAALWAFVFALLHVAWAFGWYVGLDAESARKAFERGWFLAYDLIAAGLCFLAAAIALALIQTWGRGMPRALLHVFVWTCAVILILRAAAGVIGAVYFAVTYNSFAPLFSLWDWWFCLGAGLFAASARRFWKAAR